MYEDNTNPKIQSNKPFDEVLEMKKRKEFSTREVGITHPDNPAFMRVSDSGEIEIFAAPGIGLVINPKTRSISFFADSIKFFCRDDDGLRWNGMSFNPAADVYNEPALIKTNNFLNNPAYFRNNHFLNNIENMDNPEQDQPITIMGRYGLGANVPGTGQTDTSKTAISGTEELLILEYAKTHSDSEIISIRELIESGYSFSEAIEKIKNQDQTQSNNLENFPWINDDV